MDVGLFGTNKYFSHKCVVANPQKNGPLSFAYNGSSISTIFPQNVGFPAYSDGLPSPYIKSVPYPPTASASNLHQMANAEFLAHNDCNGSNIFLYRQLADPAALRSVKSVYNMMANK